MLFTTCSAPTFYTKIMLTAAGFLVSFHSFLREHCSLTDWSAWNTSSEIGSALGIQPDESPENGREELAFPAPWRMPALRSGADSEANVTDFPGAGRTVPSPTTGKSGGERRGTGPAGSWFRTTSREVESREVLQVETRAVANTVGRRPIVATVSQCGGNGIPRLGTNQKAA